MTTERDVHWAYRYYLAREPDGAEAIAFHIAESRHDAFRLRRNLYTCAESAARVGYPVTLPEFCLFRDGRPKLVVVGNCQGPSLARVAAAMTDMSVYGFDVLNFPDRLDEVLPYLDEADHILLPILGERFGPLAPEPARRAYGDRLGLYSLPYFEGVHPDIAYLGERGARIRSPVGDYHSRLVVRSHVAGDSLFRCLDRLADGGVAGLDPKAVFARSRAEFLRRETGADIRIGDWFFKAIRKRPLLYTVNHPTAAVFAEIVRQAGRHWRFRPRETDPMLAQTTLSGNVIWPVHPAVARAAGLGYDTPDLIYAEGYAMDMAEFALRSYALYDQAPEGVLREAAAERNLI